MKRIMLIHLILAGLVLVEGVSYNEEFQINTYTKNNQEEPAITSLSNNRFVVCWESDGQDGNGGGIFAQIYDYEGQKVGEEFQVNSYTKYPEGYPSITNLSDNKFIICWESESQDGDGYGIFAQIFDDKGEKIGEEFQVNSYAEDWQRYPSITNLTDNGFVVCWESYFQDGSSYGIFAQIFDDGSQKFGEEFQINSYTEDWQRRLSVTNLSDNKFVVCWESEGQDGSGSGIYAKYYCNEPISHNLQNYNIVYPEMDGSLDTNKPEFSWQQAHKAHLNFPWDITYDLYLSKTVNFDNPIIYTEIIDTTFHIPDTLEKGQTYFWKVKAVNWTYDSLWSSNINGFYVSENATDVDNNENIIPEKFKLHQNYPNPFNPVTTIKYSLFKAGIVNVTVYDINGKKIKSLVNKYQNAGNYKINFAASGLSSGIYFYKLQVGNDFSQIRKMMFLK